MTPHRFDLVGGHPALDFLNTVHDWTAPEPRDYLAAWDDVTRFGEAAGLVSAAEARRLLRRSPGPELRALRRQRALLERLMASVVRKRKPAAADLANLSRSNAEAAELAELVSGGRGRVRRVLDPVAAGPRLVRLRLAESAAALLTSPLMERVRRCPACGWFFLDQSKNRSRRWCSMQACGSASKSRAYYRRRKAKTTS
jgi:predicted RNA-binding Zn ribbon-like protein